MQFYRRWQPVAAISFDLDDTLYDNGPAIARAEQWMLDHLRSEYLATAMLDKPRWLALKRQLLLDHPALSHDVSLARQRGKHIIGFEPRRGEDGDVQRLDDLLDPLDL